MLVQCEGYRCLAYCDKQGVWRDRNAQILNNVIKVIEEADFQMMTMWSASQPSLKPGGGYHPVH